MSEGWAKALSVSAMLGAMTTGRPTRVRTHRRARSRTVRILLVLVAVAAVVAVASVAVPLLRPAGPRPLFQLPVACGETWQLSTYPGHDDYDVDLFPIEGEAWGARCSRRTPARSPWRASTGRWAGVRRRTRKALAAAAAVTG
ncbi:hypothetical protein GCM10027614_72030 [Micromonospora vulcania]